MQSAFRSPGALIRFFLTAAIGVSLDLWTKSLAFAKLAIPLGDGRFYSKPPYQVIPGWLEFEITSNHGAVFGLGQGQRILFIVVSAGAILFLLYLFATGGKKPVYQILLGMLMAGVLGNLYDRVALGYVRDMIHIFARWPGLFRWIFNVSDSLLCVGVTLMILYSMISEDKAKPPVEAKQQAS
jgi:signal peptidase II